MKILIDNNYTDRIDQKLVEDLYYESLNTESTSVKGVSSVKGVRGAVLKRKINDVDVVVRLYRRGGLMKYFLKNTFFKSSSIDKSRPIREFYILNSLKDLDVPRVVAVAVKEHRFTYSGIIITEYIKDSFNLLNEAPKNKGLIKELSFKAGILANKIITKGVFHPDLHVGNVLYRTNGEVFIIDFDKASVISKKEKGVTKLIERWSRSVNKFLSVNKDLYIDPFTKAIRGETFN